MVEFRALTKGNFIELCQLLRSRDLVTLSQVNHDLRTIFSNECLWESHLTGLFQTQADVIECLREGALPDFNPTKKVFMENAHQLGLESLIPLNCKSLVLDMIRSEALFSKETASKFTLVHKTLEKTRELLSHFQKEPSLELLYRAAYLAFSTIPFQPVMALHLLAFIPFAINHLEPSLRIAHLGLNFDEEFEPLLELKAQVEQFIHELDGEGKTPLVINGDLSLQFKEVVGTIFTRFVKAGTRVMYLEDLGSFITVTNHGQAPPREFLEHVFREHAQPIGPRKRPGMSKQDFELFYLHLAITDPAETRADLASHGFDPDTLMELSGENALLNAAHRLSNLKI
ncbi:hypothetical protein DSO57_1036998 [Entomophthora muscae]|uniref:Uncharacterized protein n=1 Tax=Entomophthora muscae TaxID=34485 RepID=A0ACC2SZE3_9FUNG|nr:hypothetical protein DSO57_1036998 [Entomophthora muscae]